jgi:hypothetical protein
MRLSREHVSLLVVAFLIGLVMLTTAGIYDGPLAEPAMVLVFACLALLAYGFVRALSGKPAVPVASAGAWLTLLVLGLVSFAVATFADRRLLIDSAAQSGVIRGLQLVEVGLLASYRPGALGRKAEPSRWKTARFTLFALALVAGGVSVLRLSPAPHIDVWSVQQAAVQALLRGGNPYVDVHVVMTNPWKTIFSLPYPPTACYLNTIAYLAGRDVRWGTLTALLVTGVALRVLAQGDPSKRAADAPALLDDAPALFLWMTPKAFFFLEQAWNDIYPLMFVALSLVVHARGKRRWAAVLLGLGLSAKQTTVWLAPLSLLLGFGFLDCAIVAAVAAATVLPFAVANFPALKYWLFDFHATHPPETDTMSFMSFLNRHFGVVPRAAPGLVLAASCTLLALWRAPRTRYAFGLASTLAVLLFFFFNILMCMNYYFFIAGLALLGAASARDGEAAAQQPGARETPSFIRAIS